MSFGLKRFFCVLIGPNDAVLDQWEETLILSGVEFKRIRPYEFYDDKILAHNDHFILTTRHSLASEVRAVLREEHISNLIPKLPKSLMNALLNIYLAGEGKEKNKFRQKGESGPSCIRRFLQKYKGHISKQILFRTILIDEAHFLKNLSTYWSICAAILALGADKYLSTYPLINECFYCKY